MCHCFDCDPDGRLDAECTADGESIVPRAEYLARREYYDGLVDYCIRPTIGLVDYCIRPTIG